MTEQHSPFTKHFVLYKDFLGVSEAASSWEDERAERLIYLLRGIAASWSPFSMEGAAQADGSYKFRVAAEISTFSDHTVASYPIPDDPAIPIELLLDMYLKLAKDLVTPVAVEALGMGLLVRGGLTIGKLYHAEGVVFGEAMVDAYRLESRVAIYPRVVVSSRIYANIPPAERGRRLAQGSDGIWHLDCFRDVVSKIDPQSTELPTEISKLIEDQITVHERAERWNELAKWSWFKDKLLEAARRGPVPPQDADY